MTTRCCEQSERCTRTSEPCPNGWQDSRKTGPPNPWIALEARPDLKLVRHRISETGRYYDELRTIVIRDGLLLEEERRYLWHELAHADRRDVAGHNDARVERVVERHAIENAMPWETVRWAWAQSVDLGDMAHLLKLPADWVSRRLQTLHPAQKAILRAEAIEHFP